MTRRRKNGRGAVAVDLFCGAGGLTHGLKSEGIRVKVGIDLDPVCAYPYRVNNAGTKFVRKDIMDVTGDELLGYFGKANVRILAGCAPCQPFSRYNRKRASERDERWGPLRRFKELVAETRPEVVTMENVPHLVEEEIFEEFTSALRAMGYDVSPNVVDCADYGAPQQRNRLVLLAGLGRAIPLIEGTRTGNHCTVRQAIGHLSKISAGETCPSDSLHMASGLTPKNLARIRASVPGGTWRDWDSELLTDCHRRKSGRTYPSVYGRMKWDEPSPTVTTQFYGFGNGRFGHPEQDRAISLREGAILQTFPEDYIFHPPETKPNFKVTGRLIGNAVPVVLGKAIGKSILKAFG